LTGWLGWETKAEEFMANGDVLRSFMYSNGPAMCAFGFLALALLVVGMLPKKRALE
jgi:hypothetical protein